MVSLSKDLGIDIGTTFTRIADSSEILVNEPTIVAIVIEEQKLVEFGQAALNMEGRVPDTIEVAIFAKKSSILFISKGARQ